MYVLSDRITKNFTWKEVTFSSTARRLKIYNNTTDDEIITNVIVLCTDFLQPLRDMIGKPIVISSFYRCLKLNTAIGGSVNSQHMKGQAVDFECPGMSTTELFRFIVEKSGLEYDELILEGVDKPSDPHDGWVHASYVKGKNRMNHFALPHA